MADGETVLRTQAEQGEALKGFASGAKELAAELKGSDTDLRRLIAAAPDATEQISGLLRDLDPAFGVVVANLLTTSEVAVTRQRGLEELLVKLPAVAAAGASAIDADGARFGMSVTFFEPLPCTAGYGGTTYRNGLDTSAAPAVNTKARCASSPGSGINVRGSANAPKGGPVPEPFTGRAPAPPPGRRPAPPRAPQPRRPTAWPACSVWEAAHEQPYEDGGGWSALLAAVAGLRLGTWSYAQAPGRRHAGVREEPRRRARRRQAAPRQAEQHGRQERHERRRRAAAPGSTPRPDRCTTGWSATRKKDAGRLTRVRRHRARQGHRRRAHRARRPRRHGGSSSRPSTSRSPRAPARAAPSANASRRRSPAPGTAGRSRHSTALPVGSG